jgi:glyoxalase family protein
MANAWEGRIDPSMDVIRGNHHLTFSVGPAQEDYDFHTQLLGLRSIKKTALYDGKVPIYHLYYGNANGDAGAILTSFPFRQAGVMGRRGSNQITMLNLSVPAASVAFWADRLRDGGREVEEVELFGTQRLHFAHPCGIEYSLVGVDEDGKYEPWDKGGVSGEHAIRGTYGITVSMSTDPQEMVEYLENGIGARHGGEDGNRQRFEVGSSDTGRGNSVELLHEPGLEPGTWRFGEGTVHHCAYDIGDGKTQQELKDWLEGLGYTDCSDVKDRGYFLSVYNRTPSGALFEYAWSKPEGWAIDEDADHLGEEFQVPPQFADQRDEIVGMLEPLQTDKVAAT